ncbi:MAG: hypothetical protein ABI614_14530 [Planctomycetota bacterium]
MTKSKPEVRLPKRSKQFGVGKEIGGNVYVHRQYAPSLGERAQTAKSLLPDDVVYTVVKLNLATQAVTFIASPDFDTAPEPIVGDYVLVRADGTTSCRKQLDDPYIYHHKWLMVRDDYAGFDVEESKQRSRDWLALDDVDKTRIGRRSFWERTVVPRLDQP